VSPTVPLAQQVGRVPSTLIRLDAREQVRFERLMDGLLLVDMHQHTMVMPHDLHDAYAYAASYDFTWGYDAIRAGRWSTVGAACNMSALMRGVDGSYIAFEDLVDEVGLMLADIVRQTGVVAVGCAADIERAHAEGSIGVLPLAEHLAIGDQPHRVDVLYGVGVRMAGLTYARRSQLGDGQNESSATGLSELGCEVVRRMNDVGMLIDLSHAGQRTALDAIAASEAPVVFSHNAAYRLRPTRRARMDEELLRCVERGGMVSVTAVPNSLSDDPRQDVNCVLDHYDYLVKLLGVDHVGIGTDSTVGDHVGFTRLLMTTSSREPAPPAAYLDGLESPADGANLVRGLIVRGYSDAGIRKIAGANALDLLRRVIG
jgi:membrane dipeptidase